MTTTHLTIPRPVTDESATVIAVLSEVLRAGYRTVWHVATATGIDNRRIARVLDQAVEAGIVEKAGALYTWVEQTPGEVEEHASAGPVRDHTLGTVAVIRDVIGRKFVARLESRNRMWSPVLPGEGSIFFTGTLGSVVAVLHAPDEDDQRYLTDGAYRWITHPAAPKARSGKDTAAHFTVSNPATDELIILAEVHHAGRMTAGQIAADTYIPISRIDRVLDQAVAAGIVEKDEALYTWVEQTPGEVEDHGSVVHDHALGTVVVLRDSFGQRYVARLEESFNNGPGTAVNRIWIPALSEESSTFFAGTLGSVVAVLHAPDEDDLRYTAEAVYARAQESRTRDASTSAPAPEDHPTARQREAAVSASSQSR